jgi:hypothetical protein
MFAAPFLQRFARLFCTGRHYLATGPAKAIAGSYFGLARPTMRICIGAAARFVCHHISDAHVMFIYRAGLREMW